ncbi:hypothetical protein RFI_36967, partial [Reticulomyxa filosa]
MEKDIPKKMKVSSSEEANAETETEIVFVRALEYKKKKTLDLLSQINMQCQGIKDIQWVQGLYDEMGYQSGHGGLIHPLPFDHLGNFILLFIIYYYLLFLKKKNCKEVPGATEVKDEKKREGKGKKKTLLQTGDAYMMLDLGGGTTDIACHEIKNPFEVKELELIAPSGGAWGSYYIDKAFEFMLIEIFGSDHMNEFKAISFRQ